MGEGHNHQHGGAAVRSGARHQRSLAIAFVLVASLAAVQLVTALVTGSLALLSDSGHMASDVLGLGMSLAAIRLATRGSRRSTATFGLYRLEILAALANAALLFGVAVFVLIEAALRLSDPPEIASGPVLVVGTLGLIVNVVAFMLLRQGATESINIEGAYVEVLADTLGSTGVILSAGLMWATGWDWVDPVIGAAIGIFILPRAWKLGRGAFRILLQQAPERVDLGSVAADLGGIDGVVDVHDLHVWTLTSEMEVLTAHLMTGIGVDGHAVLDRARQVLHDRHGLDHATLQVEPDSHEGCSDIAW